MIDNSIQGNATWEKKFLRFVVSGLLFFVVTMPFRYYFGMMEVTEIRPAAALPPFFGMVYGFWGALGCAVANLVADMLSGYSIGMSLASFPIQLLIGILPYLLWYGIPAWGEKKPSFPKMDTTAHVVKYMLIILLDSLLTTFLLGVVMKVFGITEIFSQTTLMMFWNNLGFSYMLGLPLFTLIAFWQGRRFSLNERMILIFLILAVLAASLTGIASWREASVVSGELVYLWNRIYTNVIVTLNVFMLVEILFLVYMEKKITVPIERLAHIANGYVQIEKKELNSQKFTEACQPYLGDRTEVGDLAKSYVRMITDLDIYMEHLTKITAEKERIGAELNVATHIQSSMLPGIFPAFPERKEFEIYATMNPAKEIGGDFYDFFMVDDRHLAVVMADVSGKGVPAALFMVIGKTLIKDHTQPERSLGEVFASVNNLLCDSNKEGLFITAFEGVLDLVTGDFSYVNAGHEVPYMCKGGQGFEPYKVKPGFVLAGMEDMSYTEGNVRLEPGDKIFLYTDGVPEATNAAEKLYGKERLYHILNCNKEVPPQALLAKVKDDVDRFVGEAAQFDDITMLCLEYRGQRDNEVAE
ncbi:MAG: PP2C family protein-serine/threonine phosphatase [Clostridiales bacterium]|nr:PP2C family protein-serine/threonine phosphatase [Clostridiales bacterium]